MLLTFRCLEKLLAKLLFSPAASRVLHISQGVGFKAQSVLLETRIGYRCFLTDPLSMPSHCMLEGKLTLSEVLSSGSSGSTGDSSTEVPMIQHCARHEYRPLCLVNFTGLVSLHDERERGRWSSSFTIEVS